jgi:hypothetical protein
MRGSCARIVLLHLRDDGAQEVAAVRPLVAFIGVREMPADVAQRGGAKQRVADGVQQHVGVRVPVEPLVVRDLHAADDQLAAFHQRVHVEALPDPHVLPFSLLARMDSAIAMSSG